MKEGERIAVNVRVRQATRADADELTRIAFAAKRHWNYPEDWIALWADELTVDADYVEANRVFVAASGRRVVGWCAVTTESGECWLDYCWVLPEAAGRGVGRRLMRRALAVTAELRAPALKVVADPHATGFYRKLGFRQIGERPSVPVGRRLPVLEFGPVQPTIAGTSCAVRTR